MLNNMVEHHPTSDVGVVLCHNVSVTQVRQSPLVYIQYGSKDLWGKGVALLQFRNLPQDLCVLIFDSGQPALDVVEVEPELVVLLLDTPNVELEPVILFLEAPNVALELSTLLLKASDIDLEQATLVLWGVEISLDFT